MKLERGLLVNLALGLAALGSLAVVFATRERPTTEQLQARANNLFPVFAAKELRAIRVQGEKTAFSLEIEPSLDAGEASYRVRSGGAAPIEADPEAALGVVRALELAAFLRRLDAAAVDRKSLGLDRPRLEVKLELASSKAALRVGKAALTPAGTAYVEVSGPGHDEPAFGLVRDDLLKQLAISADDLRPRRLVAYAPSELQAIRFDAPGARAELRRGAGPAWLDASGSRVRRDSVERLLLELGEARIDRFVDPAPARARLDADGALTASFTPDRGRPRLEFRVGSSCPSAPELAVVERTSPAPAAGCVSSGVGRVFAEVARALDDTAPFALHMDEVEVLVIERGSEKLELRRNEHGFRLVLPSAADVALETGNRRIRALTGALGERVAAPDLAALGLAPPAGRVRLTSAAIERAPRFEERLELGRPAPDDRLPVRRVEDGVVLLLSRDAARAFAVDGTLLKSPRLLDFGPSDLGELEISWAGQRERLRSAPGGGFELLEPRGHSADGGLAMDLAQTLGTLGAERWVADRDDGSFGLDRPRLTLRARLAPGKPRASFALEVGAATSGGFYARLDFDPGVFVLRSSTVRRLETLVLSRSVFAVDRASIARVAIERDGRRLELERRGEEFVARAGSEVPRSLAERAIEGVTGLRPEAALHAGAARPEQGFGAPRLLIRVTPRDAAAGAKTIRVGKAWSWDETNVFFARVDGVDATYALPENQVRELLELF